MPNRRAGARMGKWEGAEPWGAWKTKWWRRVWSQAGPEGGGRALTCLFRVLALTPQLWGDGLNDSVTLSGEHMLCKVCGEPFQKSLNDFFLNQSISKNLRSV